MSIDLPRLPTQEKAHAGSAEPSRSSYLPQRVVFLRPHERGSKLTLSAVAQLAGLSHYFQQGSHGRTTHNTTKMTTT